MAEAACGCVAQMTKNMDPKMMQQAQSMMSNPAMAKQAAAAMEGMDATDMKAKLDMAAQTGALPAGMPAAKPPPAATSVAEKLKASPMSIPDELIAAVEKAEAAKKKGNDKFKAQEYSAAAEFYTEGAAAVEEMLTDGDLSGADKQVRRLSSNLAGRVTSPPLRLSASPPPLLSPPPPPPHKPRTPPHTPPHGFPPPFPFLFPRVLKAPPPCFPCHFCPSRVTPPPLAGVSPPIGPAPIGPAPNWARTQFGPHPIRPVPNSARTHSARTVFSLQAVVDLKEACHLNNANCQLKLDNFSAAVGQASTVLERGANRKAYFRRGQAYHKMNQLSEAREDLKKAIEMDPSDTIVAAALTEVEATLGVKPTKVAKPAAPAAPKAAAAPTMPPGMPTGAAMDEMLDKITPEQMKQQAEMLENMDPAQLSAMAPQAIRRSHRPTTRASHACPGYSTATPTATPTAWPPTPPHPPHHRHILPAPPRRNVEYRAIS